MSLLNKFKTNSYCVGGRHYSCTNNISGAITSKGIKMLRGSCTKCRRNRSMTVSDATIEAEGLQDFFKSVGKATVNFGKKVASSPVRALGIASKIESAAASKNSRAALSATPDIIKFATPGEGIKVVQKGRGLYLGTKKDNLVMAKAKVKTKTIVSIIALILPININTNIIITKNNVITKH